RTVARYEEELGREPTDEELGLEFNIASSRVARIRMAMSAPISLDADVIGADSRSYAETIADESIQTPYQMLENKSVSGMVTTVINTLTQQERSVLYLRFGLNGDEPRNLEETGKELQISGERARQVQNIAFRKLRNRILELEKHLPVIPELRQSYALFYSSSF
ncbi:MAG TPA: sigma factor-like helix-turn-helix DNA-binding protein, partial [Verrucomicrobiae bacterium]